MDAETIWSVLRAKAPSKAPLIEDLVQDAAGKLRLVRETFPTYTLHDDAHTANVLRLMGELLGQRVTDLSGLEAAVLVLAASYHDIGMVYTPDELAAVASEPEFAAYLSTRHEDYLAVRAAGGEPPPDVLERYCRSRHADRVYVHLSGLADRLVWGNAPLCRALGEVCRSHNLPTSDLKSDDFDPDFLAQCDLRLCALLLRLADILDLDSSRAPQAIYDHLGLAGRRTTRTAVSDGEWRKHLCADGFAFPSSRPPNYPLPFIAGPDHPAVEHDIRAFLDAVDDELRRARPVLDTCAPRWRDLSLPGEVDRRNIIGRGYTYGAFRFELDRAAVLRLFTGERLYSDPHVFVRELLQNAIDAVRLRQALGHAGDGAGVAVTAWEEGDGFLWVRVDDDGVGMDERTLAEYFLRVGRSYYASVECRADLARRGRPDGDFVAIGRFGIGVLSCFLAGDLVELSTLRVLPDGSFGRPLRLSLARDEEFFVLRQLPDRPTPMPRAGRDGPETGFRRRPGTSIAVRVDPTKVDVTVDRLAERVDSCLRWPPVPVTFRGRPAGDPPVDDLDDPLLDAPLVEVVPVSARSRPDESRGDRLPYLGPLEIAVLPLDLTAAAPTSKLRGQVVAVGAHVPPASDGRPVSDLLAGWPDEELARVPPRLRELCATAVRGHSAQLDEEGSGLTVTVEHDLAGADLERIRRELELFQAERSLLGALLSELSRDLDPPSLRLQARFAGQPLATVRRHLDRHGRYPFRVRLAHNGMALPGIVSLRSAHGILVSGGIALGDHLRPDLDVSRTVVGSIPFAAYSAAQYALRQAARPHATGPLAWLAVPAARIDLLDEPSRGEPSLGMALSDPLMAGGQWDAEAVFDLGGRPVTAVDLRRVAAETVVSVPLAPTRYRRWEGWNPGTFLRAAILQAGLDLIWSPEHGLAVRSGRVPDLRAGLRRFPPLYFVPYQAPAELLLHYWPLEFDVRPPVNLANPLARWLVDNADALAAELPVLLTGLRRELDNAYPRDLNRLLERVAALRPDLAPPPEAYLRDDNPEGEWWTR